MAAITTFLYRLGATAANIAQSVLQANGGGNGDPQVFDETSKRATKPVVTAADESEDSEKRHDR
ncbi:hypothetical protein I6E52_08100 [Salinibacterium sp. NG253]|uniref:hypothetical protein n=1 Tax=Salinibacterium sp. NG253 TaxID=2792039 RepID=UPI0018CCF7CF|nr:hypothetical protein [Salinibacterium sp. NG253]MBH0116809.1 hypothetical protein [Salinibacterium sp. NG253]